MNMMRVSVQKSKKCGHCLKFLLLLLVFLLLLSITSHAFMNRFFFRCCFDRQIQLSQISMHCMSPREDEQVSLCSTVSHIFVHIYIIYNSFFFLSVHSIFLFNRKLIGVFPFLLQFISYEYTQIQSIFFPSN